MLNATSLGTELSSKLKEIVLADLDSMDITKPGVSEAKDKIIKRIEDTSNAIAEVIVNHIQTNMEVLCASNINSIISAMQSPIIVPTDGGASLITSINTSITLAMPTGASGKVI